MCPITEWALGPLAATLEDLLGPASLARRGLFRPEYVAAIAAGPRRAERDPPPARRRAALDAGDAGGVDARVHRRQGPTAGRLGMKCIRCGNDSKYKDRDNRTCPNCMGKFAFEPQERRPGHGHALLECDQGRLRRRQGSLGCRTPVLRGVPPQARDEGAHRLRSCSVAPLGADLLHDHAVARAEAVSSALLLRRSSSSSTLVAIASRFRGPFVKIELAKFNRSGTAGSPLTEARRCDRTHAASRNCRRTWRPTSATTRSTAP